MNPEIKKLIELLRRHRSERFGLMDGLCCAKCNETWPCNASSAAVILQAIFDPENQPSQFGTVLENHEANTAE